MTTESQKSTIWDLPVSLDIWRMKYRWQTEEHPIHSATRVCQGVYQHDSNVEALGDAIQYMRQGIWLPAGRIWAGAGTSKVVTLMNCYVMGTMPDSMIGISDTLKETMLTLQQGGGIGVDFSTLRPKKAYLKRTQSEASGPIKFMETWNTMCQTIMSAGSRRGAMMATMSDTHPDLPEFIEAKSRGGALTNFNVSVLVSDAFIAALEDDAEWPLYFHEPTFDKRDMYGEFEDDDGTIQYIYSVWRARDLWNLITEYTYEYSEPGVIFIDRINELNNLSYREEIRCTNPCGEQPLPPYAACNLGAVNLARCVKNPFQPDAELDLDTVVAATRVGVRFLDNVIDTTQYPLSEQKREELSTRRIGLGITGMADMLAQLSIRYGSKGAKETVGKVMQTIANTAYQTSALLAKERNPFPDYKLDILRRPFIQKLSQETRRLIETHGLRNGVLLTVAPTGTTSVFCGNISSGVEPIFSHFQDRRVLKPDNSWHVYSNVPGYSARLFSEVKGGLTPKQIMSDGIFRGIAPMAHELSIQDHLVMQGVVQEWVDASVSKTINIPRETPYEEFRDVYEQAYKLGCKGCTTYRPSKVRGEVLSVSTLEEPVQQEAPAPALKAAEETSALVGARGDAAELWERPESLEGYTYRIKWPGNAHSLYLTINHDADGVPREIFIQSRDGKHQEWTTALTLMLSAIMRKGGDITFIPRVLRGIQSTDNVGWIKGKSYGSLVAYIAHVLGEHFEHMGINDDDAKEVREAELLKLVANVAGERCPQCNAPAVIAQEGCKTCQACGFSNCG